MVGSGLGRGSKSGVNVLYHDHAGCSKSGNLVIETISTKLWKCDQGRTDEFGACNDRTAVFGRSRERPSEANAAFVSPSLVFVSCDNEMMERAGANVPRPWNMMRRFVSWPFGDDE